MDKRIGILLWSVVIVVMMLLGTVFGCVYLSFFFSLALGLLTLAGGLFATAIMSFSLFWFKWGTNNLYCSFIPENWGKIVVRGDAVTKIIIQSKDSELDADWNVIPRSSSKRSWWRKLLGGLYFYGYWPLDDILIYDFGWTNVTQDGEIEHNPKRPIDYFILKPDIYYAKVSRAEDRDLLPLDIELVLALRIINPYKAIFKIQNWLEAVIRRLEPAVRNTITTDSYENWIRTSGKDLGEEILKSATVQDIIADFKSSYGVELISLGVKNIDPGKEYRDMTVQKAIALRSKDATIVNAEAERRRIKKVYGAIDELGETGRLVRTLEAFERAPAGGEMMRSMLLFNAAQGGNKTLPGMMVGGKGGGQNPGGKGGKKGKPPVVPKNP